MYNGFQETQQTPQKAKEKKRKAQNGTRPKTKRHKHPKRHSEGTWGAITAELDNRYSVSNKKAAKLVYIYSNLMEIAKVAGAVERADSKLH